MGDVPSIVPTSSELSQAQARLLAMAADTTVDKNKLASLQSRLMKLSQDFMNEVKQSEDRFKQINTEADRIIKESEQLQRAA